MNCETTRAQMLVADLSELAGVGASPIAGHVRSCAECRARAATILRDSRIVSAVVAREDVAHLPAVVGRRNRARAVRRVWMGALTTATAASILFAVDRQREELRGPATSVLASEVPREVHDQPAVPIVVAPEPAPVAARRFADAQPIAAVRLRAPISTDEPATAGERAAVRVDLPAGVRAAVLRTSNPTITVVWMY